MIKRCDRSPRRHPEAKPKDPPAEPVHEAGVPRTIAPIGLRPIELYDPFRTAHVSSLALLEIVKTFARRVVQICQ
jgi:hypothetical protein